MQPSTIRVALAGTTAVAAIATIFAVAQFGGVSGRSAVTQASYVARNEPCGANRGSGTTDANGVAYAACKNTIITFTPGGKVKARMKIGTKTFDSVAPSPDGTYLYVSLGYRLRRLVKSGTTYKLDTAWAPAKYTAEGETNLPVVRDVRTDEFGNIYISNNGTDPTTKQTAPNRILKYTATGAYVTGFGEYGTDVNNPYDFYVNRGIAVTRDGRSIYVTIELRGQIRRYDFQPDGSYQYAQTIGSLDTACKAGGGLSAVSDVAVDPWGYVYAADTSCGKLKKYKSDGTYVGTIANMKGVNVHAITLTRNGNIFAHEWQKFFTRADGNKVPGPIPAITNPGLGTSTGTGTGGGPNAAPVISSFTVPATGSGVVTFALSATDDGDVAQLKVRFVDDWTGEWSPWYPYSSAPTWQLPASPNRSRSVVAQVKDSAGVLSAETAPQPIQYTS